MHPGKPLHADQQAVLANRLLQAALDACGALDASLDVALIDYTGGIGVGRLVRGDNPVLMTMELVLEAS